MPSDEKCSRPLDAQASNVSSPSGAEAVGRTTTAPSRSPAAAARSTAHRSNSPAPSNAIDVTACSPRRSLGRSLLRLPEAEHLARHLTPPHVLADGLEDGAHLALVFEDRAHLQLVD